MASERGKEKWPCGCVKGETPHGAGWGDCEFAKARASGGDGTERALTERYDALVRAYHYLLHKPADYRVWTLAQKALGGWSDTLNALAAAEATAERWKAWHAEKCEQLEAADSAFAEIAERTWSIGYELHALEDLQTMARAARAVLAGRNWGVHV